MYVRTVRASPPLALAFALAAATAALGAMAFLAESRARRGAHDAPAALRPDLNAAPERHLLLLPGIGPSRARAIVEDRTRNGPFASATDLERVKGIGPATASALAALVRAPERPRDGPTGADP
jgi:competence protein ComEA